MPESKWIPMFALPNVEIREAVEVDGFALVSIHDERLQILARRHRRFGSYLKRFKNEFGVVVTPSILMMREDAPERFRSVEAIARFRDAIAISYISRGWTLALKWNNTTGTRYSDYFYIFPWMVDKNYEGLISNTLNMIGWHEVKALRAQCSPGMSTQILTKSEADQPLLGALLSRWKEYFAEPKPGSQNEKLFRSLNMANAAARMPAGVDVTMLDIGRSVALWASAFEILVPTNGNAFKKVYALLEKNAWNLSACNEQKYKPYGKDETLRSLPVWIFGEIYSARHDYLHGNPITENRLIVSPAKRPLHIYAAPLYRMALAAFLELKMPDMAERDGLTAYEEFISHDFQFGKYQRDIESALSTIMFTKEELEQNRQAKVAEAMRRSRHGATRSQ